MTPIEVMNEAYETEFKRWRVFRAEDREGLFAVGRDTDGSALKNELICAFATDDEAQEHWLKSAGKAAIRAALLALVEMEPTEDMVHAARHASVRSIRNFSIIDGSKAYILAAANEGQSPPPEQAE